MIACFLIGLYFEINATNQSANAIKDPQWYAVQGSDTTMLTIAASLPGQQSATILNTAPIFWKYHDLFLGLSKF